MAGKSRYREFALYPTYERAYKKAFEKMLLVRKLEGKDDSTGGWIDAEHVFKWWMDDARCRDSIKCSWMKRPMNCIIDTDLTEGGGSHQ